MEKLYTREQYSEACQKANAEGKIVKLVQKEVEYDIEVLEYNYVDRYIDTYDEEGNITGKELAIEIHKIYDEEFNEIGEETVTLKDAVPIMVEEEIIDPITGEKKTVTVQKHHTETRVKTVEEIEIIEDENKLQREFFNTSLGYVRRTVRMKDGTEKNFLSDVLPLLQVGVQILVYDIDGNQSMAVVTEEFIKECQAQYLKDFYGDI